MNENENENESKPHGDEVFVFFERLTPIAGKEDEVLELTRKSAEALQGQPGLMQSIVARSQRGDGQIQSMSMWRSKADFSTFMKTDAVAEMLASEDFANVKKWMTDYEMQMNDLVDGWHG